MTETIRTDNSEALKNALLRIKAIEEQIEYAKAIIQDLLDNSDEYARQRAMDFLEEVENEAD